VRSHATQTPLVILPAPGAFTGLTGRRSSDMISHVPRRAIRSAPRWHPRRRALHHYLAPSDQLHRRADTVPAICTSLDRQCFSGRSLVATVEVDGDDGALLCIMKLPPT